MSGLNAVPLHLLDFRPKTSGGAQNSLARTHGPAASGLENACEHDLVRPPTRPYVAGDARPVDSTISSLKINC